MGIFKDVNICSDHYFIYLGWVWLIDNYIYPVLDNFSFQWNRVIISNHDYSMSS